MGEPSTAAGDSLQWKLRLQLHHSSSRPDPPPSGGAGDGFYLLRGVKLPDTHNCAMDAGVTLEECARRCLANCSCTAYSAADVRGGRSGCIQWFGDLVDTRLVDGGQDLFCQAGRV